MIVVAQFIWVASLLAGVIAVGWLISRAAGDRDRIEELIDRADQILANAPTVTLPAVMPRPTPGPATVPTHQAIDAGYRAVTTGRHARSEG